MPTQSQAHPVTPSKSQKRFFTLEQANLALPYVSRIVEDVRAAYKRAVKLQHRMDHNLPADDVELVHDEYEQTIDRLNCFVDELQEVGVELKDYEVGLIDFPSIHEEREICLCWKSGEENIEAWHETDAGFAGRKDVTSLCKGCKA